MISRKGTVLVGTALAAVLAASLSFSFAADEKSKAHILMEKVSKTDNAIKKNTKNAAAFKKGQKDVVTASEALVKLAKEAREDTEVAKKEKKTQAEWTKFCDDFIKESETFAKEASLPTAKQDTLKNAYKAVQKTCNDCHAVFHKDDE